MKNVGFCFLPLIKIVRIHFPQILSIEMWNRFDGQYNSILGHTNRFME